VNKRVSRARHSASPKPARAPRWSAHDRRRAPATTPRAPRWSARAVRIVEPIRPEDYESVLLPSSRGDPLTHFTEACPAGLAARTAASQCPRHRGRFNRHRCMRREASAAKYAPTGDRAALRIERGRDHPPIRRGRDDYSTMRRRRALRLDPSPADTPRSRGEPRRRTGRRFAARVRDGEPGIVTSRA